MKRKIVAVWVSLAMLFGLVVIVDVVTDITPQVKAATITVDDSGGADYLTIQEGIDAANPGDTVFVYNGAYYGNVVVDKTLNLTGEDRENTVIDANGVGDVVSISTNWVNITGLTIKGAAGGSTYAGVKMDRVHNIKIFNVNISDNGLGINIIESSNNRITDNILSNNFFGVQLIYSSNNTIVNNSVCNNTLGIWISSSLNINVTNNIFINDGVSIVGTQFNHYYSHSIPANNLVNGNPLYYYKDTTNLNIDGELVGQIILVNCSGFNIKNLSINYTIMGIIMAFSTNNNITHNNIMQNNWAISLAFSQGNNISYNKLSSNRAVGIMVDYSSDYNVINYNNVSSTYYNGRGIQIFRSSSNNNISNNIVMNNSDWGIYISALSKSNTITNNTVSYNRNGIRLKGYSDYNYITNNKVILNDVKGLQIIKARNNIITENNISNNGDGINISHSSAYNKIYNNTISTNNEYGIFIDNSANNSIYHNNILDNFYQGSDNNRENYWDNGYPLGGNYWSDYLGIDNFKGPNQDILGGDGIGDTNYSIDSDSVDHFPLMKPYKPIKNYTILKQGWNLISIPIIQEEQNLTRVLGSIDSWYDAVQWHDITNPVDFWKHHKVGKSFGNDLFHLNESMGFWIYITQPGNTTFLYNGTQPTSNQSIPFHPGWNMVGYPTLSNRTRDNALNNINYGTDVDAIWTFNAATQTMWEIGPTDYFELGRGYWIHSKVTKVWDVPL